MTTEHTHTTGYTFADRVYLRVSTENMPGIVTQINLRTLGCLYEITWGNRSSSWHYDFELTNEYLPDFK